MSQLPHSALEGSKGALPFSRPTTPSALSPQIGFVGLGSMGYLMARNLTTHRISHAADSPPLLVWNRSTAKAEKLLKEVGQDNVRIAKDLAQIANECDVIITNLANDTVVRAVYEDFSKALTHTPPARNKIFVETSTVYPTLAGELDTLISSAPHSHLITCPIFGTPAVADKSQLVIIMSGDYRSKKEIAYLLVPAIGRKVVDLGVNVEKAPTFKLIGNSMILGSLEILAEAFTISEKCGIGSHFVNELVTDILPAPGLVAYSNKLTHDLFDGSKGFAIEGGIKDASHIHRLSVEHNAPMPAIDVAYQHLITARALHAAQKGEGKQMFDSLDWSAIIAGNRVAAGLDGFSSAKHTGVVEGDWVGSD